MKTISKSVLFGFCTIYAVAMLYNQAWAIALSFSPSTSFFDVGDPINVDIIISGMETDNLAEFSFDINFDDSILTFDSYALGSELTDPFWGQDDWSLGDLGGGVINLSELSWLWDFSSQPDTFTLATVSFTGTSLGTSSLSFSNVILGDYWGNSLSADLETGTVSPVPEPATIILLGTGLAAGLVGFRKRFQQG